MEYKHWTQACLKAFTTYDQGALTNLLFSQNKIKIPASDDLRETISEILLSNFNIQDGDSKVWVTFLSEHLDSQVHKAQAFKHTNSAYQALVTIFKEDDEGYKLMQIVKKYSKKLLDVGTSSNSLDEVINSFRKLISACQNNKPPPDSHVIGLIFSINISIKTCFRLNNLQQLTSLLRIVNNPHSKFPKLLTYPKAQQVEMKLYEGKFYLFENNWEDAANALDIAYRKCRGVNKNNEKLILRYLIPVNAVFGKYASTQLLEKYELEEYKEILASVRTGEIAKVEELLYAYQENFIKFGIFIVMDSLRMATYKNLFKKVLILLKQNSIPLEVFEKTLVFAGVPNVTRSKVASLFNTLIFRNWLKAKLDLIQATVHFSNN